ncbi:MAG TPA: serine/threonine-protein kinase [Gemmatimonadaceae bacterium]|nr:serine/threonine-protein kinase [Gemmatimonadaceae bacterium]
MSGSDERDSENPATTTSPDAVASDTPPDQRPAPRTSGEVEARLLHNGLGSGLLAQQPTPTADEAVAVAKVCPQCGGEYETGDRFCPKDGSPLRPKSGGDPLVGRVIAERYLVLALLGEGGMGRVYLAEHVKMNRQCAIKVMNPSLVNDTESSQRFAREASSAARILHPNVAAVFDYGESDKIVYLVMEYVDGESLSTILEASGALEPRRAIEIARQIADGLAAAHELGIVHRDLKPDNVIVARNRSGKEIPKIVDFGIAKAVSETPQDSLTRSGLVIGTPEFMSPEQLLGDPLDARSDIYSLGCILYQMLTGKPAFEAESREQMIRRRLHEPPPHIREIVPNLPRRLDTLIVHMLARSPSDRLATAAEAREALDPALALGGWDPKVITAQRPTPRMSMHAANSDRVSDPTLRPTLPMPRQRGGSPRGFTTGAVGVGLLVGTVFFWSLRRADLPPSALVPPDSSPGTASLAGTSESLTTRLGARAPVSPGVHVPTKADSAILLKRDSLVAAAEKRVTTDTVSTHVPIQQFANTVAAADSAKLVHDYPSLPDHPRESLASVFRQDSSLRVTPVYVASNVHTDHAEVSFELRIDYYDTGKQKRSASFPFNATLERKAGRWAIRELKSSSNR